MMVVVLRRTLEQLGVSLRLSRTGRVVVDVPDNTVLPAELRAELRERGVGNRRPGRRRSALARLLAEFPCHGCSSYPGYVAPSCTTCPRRQQAEVRA